MKYLAVIALLASTSVFAEMQRPSATYAGSTNAIASAVSYTNTAHGLLYRLTLVSGTSGANVPTNTVQVLDSDGTVLFSNVVTSTTITTNYATPQPFVGLVIKVSGADTNISTVTVTPTNLR